MIDQNIQDTVERLIVESLKVMVPQVDRDDFDDSLISVTDGLTSFDMINYFNGLQKLKLINCGIKAAFISNPDRQEQSIQITSQQSAGLSSDVLDSEEFVEAGFNRPVVEQKYEFTYHVVKQGETLRSIAEHYYADWEKWTIIAKANNLRENDLIDTDMVGDIIRIPVEPDQSFNRGDNLVFCGEYDSSSLSGVQKYIYGSDIATNNKKILISGKNDISIVEGIDCIMDNVSDLVSSRKGSLNDLHPNWGIEMPSQNLNEPFFIAIENMLVDIESQVLVDPRVVSAKINRSTLKIIGDVISFSLDIDLIGGFSGTLEVSK